MAETLALEIVTPDGVKLTEAVDMVTAPGVDGEFGVLPRHRPLLAALTAGIVTYTKSGVSESVAIGPGFAEVSDDRATLLTDKFASKDDIDPVRVRLELKEVDEALDHFAGDPTSPEYSALVARELWAATQLELHGDPPPPRIRTQSELESSVVEKYRAPSTENDEQNQH
ncbi:MAG TPA: ATP synthase F1 subunit epsilon [Polyangiaceae bacterium]